jgi:hypothetical protein
MAPSRLSSKRSGRETGAGRAAGSYLPSRASAKAGLNKAVPDAGWAQFITTLTGKPEETGR